MSEPLCLLLQEPSLEGSSSGSAHKEDSKQAPDKSQVCCSAPPCPLYLPLVTSLGVDTVVPCYKSQVCCSATCCPLHLPSVTRGGRHSGAQPWKS